MDLHDFLNVRRIFRMLAKEWGCPVWVVKLIIRQGIDKSWEEALHDPEHKALWDMYFPGGKPTPGMYILRLGQAHENGEKIPFLIEMQE